MYRACGAMDGIPSVSTPLTSGYLHHHNWVDEAAECRAWWVGISGCACSAEASRASDGPEARSRVDTWFVTRGEGQLFLSTARR